MECTAQACAHVAERPAMCLLQSSPRPYRTLPSGTASKSARRSATPLATALSRTSASSTSCLCDCAYLRAGKDVGDFSTGSRHRIHTFPAPAGLTQVGRQRLLSTMGRAAQGPCCAVTPLHMPRRTQHKSANQHCQLVQHLNKAKAFCQARLLLRGLVSG